PAWRPARTAVDSRGRAADAARPWAATSVVARGALRHRSARIVGAGGATAAPRRRCAADRGTTGVDARCAGGSGNHGTAPGAWLRRVRRHWHAYHHRKWRHVPLPAGGTRT